MRDGGPKAIPVSGPPGPAAIAKASALLDVIADIKAVLTAADLSSARAAFGLAIGTGVQAWSATLDALAGLATTAFGRSLLTQADAPTALGTLGAVPASRQVATATGSGLTGGGALSNNLQLAIAANGVTNAMLATVPAYTLKANLLASTANPSDVGLSALIDAAFGATRGALLYRGASGWGLLAPGTSGQYLGTGGSGADPAWGTPQGAGNVSTANSPTAGQLAAFASGSSIQGLGLPLGQCRLVYASTSQLLLKPCLGNLLWVNGAFRTIPSAGVALANTGLAAGTLYYVYALLSGSTLTLEASTTGHATDATYGHEIKSGDGTRTLVGMVYMASGSPGTFADSLTQRYVATWFNRRTVIASSPVTGATSSTSYANVGNTLSLLIWGDEALIARITGQSSNNTAGQTCATINYLDGAGAGSSSGQNSASANVSGAVSAELGASAGGIGEGLHTLAPYGTVSGGSGTWNAVQTATTRS